MLWVGLVSHFRGFPKQRIRYLIFHVGPCLTTLPTHLSKHGKHTKIQIKSHTPTEPSIPPLVMMSLTHLAFLLGRILVLRPLAKLHWR
jgi:hypothetical protein